VSFTTILIANRGEIARRVIRTARALGYRTVAVYSDADADAPHVAEADRAVRIGPAPVADSYLSIPALLHAATLGGADAVHPGYGFLSENADFAAAVEAAGLVFIGPTPEAIRLMGNKRIAKLTAAKAGVPMLPGYNGGAQDDATLLREAERIGLPLMVKAAAGGGGRGLRSVLRADDLARAISAARSEARNAFGSGELILERALLDPRHIEIQVFADSHGNAIHLGERDCSTQRRHQKVIEEAPSPAVSADLRARMGAAAVAAAKAIGYRGAGTIEFLLDGDGRFYFMEMNTRLQVEHPVTEMITGFDLVAWQLAVAAGEPLPASQEQVTFQGHAIEVRLYAEDPAAEFLPQSGRILAWSPAGGIGIRVDDGIVAGQEIAPHYDPMLAKVIAHGADRAQARRRLIAALQDSVLFGPADNRRFLIDLLRHPTFAHGRATTGFIARDFPAAHRARHAPPSETLALAAALLYQRQNEGAEPWRTTGSAATSLELRVGDVDQAISVEPVGAGYRVAGIDEQPIELAILGREGPRLRILLGGVRRTVAALFEGETLHLDDGQWAGTLSEAPPRHVRQAAAGGDGRLLAPMSGRIVAVHGVAGDSVAKGQPIVILEAMKIEHEIKAAGDGLLAELLVRPGDQVAARQLLARVEALSSDGST